MLIVFISLLMKTYNFEKNTNLKMYDLNFVDANFFDIRYFMWSILFFVLILFRF